MIAVLATLSILALVGLLLYGAERWSESLDDAIERAFRELDLDEDDLP